MGCSQCKQATAAQRAGDPLDAEHLGPKTNVPLSEEAGAQAPSSGSRAGTTAVNPTDAADQAGADPSADAGLAAEAGAEVHLVPCDDADTGKPKHAPAAEGTGELGETHDPAAGDPSSAQPAAPASSGLGFIERLVFGKDGGHNEHHSADGADAAAAAPAGEAAAASPAPSPTTDLEAGSESEEALAAAAAAAAAAAGSDSRDVAGTHAEDTAAAAAAEQGPVKQESWWGKLLGRREEDRSAPPGMTGEEEGSSVPQGAMRGPGRE